MSSNKIKVDALASTVMKGLEEYASLAIDDMKSAVKKTANTVRKDIQSSAPVDTGKYKKSWAVKKTHEDSTTLQCTVYSKNRYQIAHLLEKGHANRNGGRTKAYPHIAPAKVAGEKQLKELIKKSLKG